MSWHGAGLCEYLQHASIFDYIAISSSLENRSIFLHPCVLHGGHYCVPREAGASITLRPASLSAHVYPQGSVWRGLDANAREA